jgi:zinc transporter, ZIP family
MLLLLLLASLTTLATGLGVFPVFWLGERARSLQPVLWGIAAGVMAVASVVGLLRPALDDGSTAVVGAGLATGASFLALARLRLTRSHEVQIGALSGADVRTSVLVFTVLTVHSLPEGFAIGTAYASDVAGLSAYVVIAIALQNIPEGTSVAIPMINAGFSHRQQLGAAVLTSAPQPIGAAIAYLMVETITGLLPFSFGFAAGAMLALVASDLLPRALRREHRAGGLSGLVAGALVMLALSAVLGV